MFNHGVNFGGDQRVQVAPQRNRYQDNFSGNRAGVLPAAKARTCPCSESRPPLSMRRGYTCRRWRQASRDSTLLSCGRCRERRRGVMGRFWLVTELVVRILEIVDLVMQILQQGGW